MFLPSDVIWSKVPVIDTFGAGGGVCANAGRTGIARTTSASTAVTRLLLITASSSVVNSIESVSSQRRHHQQLQAAIEEPKVPLTRDANTPGQTPVKRTS